MKLSAQHRLIGLILLIPLCLWAATGAFFIVKPGYDDAYQKLAVTHYPLDTFKSINVSNNELNYNKLNKNNWLEVRRLKTILGEHLLVKTAAGWQQLDPHNLKPRPTPPPQELRLLIDDAIKNNKQRYGEITEVTLPTFITSTGAAITLNWNNINLSQRGQDTEFISNMYKLHYLEWTSNETINQIIEIILLAMLLLLTLIGGWMSLKKR